MPKQNISVKRTVFTSLSVDILDVILNSIAAILTGSVVMLAETLQGISDLISDLFLIIGLRTSENKSKKYTFGGGKAIYFWVLLSVMIMIFFTAGLSIYFGIQRIVNPRPLQSLFITYLILIISVFTNGYAVSVSSRRLLDGKEYKYIFKAFRETNRVTTRSTFIFDLSGVLGALTGLIAISVSVIAGNPIFDGIGAIAIGIIMISLSLYQINKLREMLIGKNIHTNLKNNLKKEILKIPEVTKITGLKGMHIGVEKLFIILDIKVKRDLKTTEIEKVVKKLKEKIKKAEPKVKEVQIELSD